MPQTVLDCKQLPCPQPVLECKKLLDNGKPQAMSVLVDNDAARENVTRFLVSQGYIVQTESDNGIHTVNGALNECETCEVMPAEEIAALAGGTAQSKVCVFITANTLGRGDETLGAKLMKAFLATLPEMGSDLWRLMLVNSGVKLAVADSPALDELKAIQDFGVTILVCGTCLDHFTLLDKKAVGETTNMLDIVTAMQLASKVIQV